MNVEEQCDQGCDIPAHVGLIAGQGDFPLLIARAARTNGVRVTAFAISGFASDTIGDCADDVCWVELGQVQKVIDELHGRGIGSVIMAGKVPHTSVLQYRHFDWRAVKMLAGAINRKPDSLLRAVTDELEKENVRVLDSSMFIKSFMPSRGMLTSGRPLTEDEEADMEFGYPIAKVVAGQDIGQTIVVKQRMVIAVEGVEGTDECMRRAAALAGPGCVVVKVSKPAQDMRFDIPVAGKDTVRVMAETGCSALCLTAGESLVLERETVAAMADAAGIAICAR